MTSIEERIDAIESRNARVESDKRWETSWIRRSTIAILTYATVVVYHYFIGAKNIFIISLVPVLGFMISTISLQFVRERFERR